MTQKNVHQLAAAPTWLLRPQIAFWLIVLVHLAVAIYLQAIVGVDIRANPGGRPWDWWWQTIDQDLLVGDLLRSLWYLHSQPPLYNLYGALFFNLVPSQPMVALQISNVFLGAVLSGLIYIIIVIATGRRFLSLLLGLFLAVDPGLFLFEAYILYDLLTTFLVVASTAMLAAYSLTGRLRYATLFILSLTVLVLSRSLYHLLVVGVGLLIVALADRRQARRILWLGLLLSLIPAGWYAKNQALYGFFGASSWQGYGVWKVVAEGFTKDELAALADAGIITPVTAEVEVNRLPSDYAAYGYTAQSTIPLLSRDDRHNLNIVAVAQTYQRDALKLVMREPGQYLRSAIYAYSIFNIPSAQFKHHVPNAAKLGRHAWLTSEYLQGHFLEQYLHYPIGSIFFFLIPMCLGTYAASLLWHLFWRKKGLAAFLEDRALDTWIIYLIGYTTLVSVLFEVGENNRERFYVEQLITVYCVLLVVRLYAARTVLLPIMRRWSHRAVRGFRNLSKNGARKGSVPGV